MPKYIVKYSRTFTHEIECESMNVAHHRSANFAIGMGSSLSDPIKIVSIFAVGYVSPPTTEEQKLTAFETMAAGMRKQIDSLLT